MKKIYRHFSFFVLFIAIILVVSGCGRKSEPVAEQPAIEKGSEVGEVETATSSSEIAETATSTDEIKNSGILGIIEGSLSYPSEIIPELEICAENIKTQKKYCTKRQLYDEKYIYNRGYKIEVPVGEYSVFAEDNNSNKAFYSEFVVCGMKTECLSHKLIIVNVDRGRTVVDINPFDWYKQ